MLKGLLKTIPFLVVIALIVPGVSLFTGNAIATPSTSTTSHQVVISITNNLSVSTPAPYDEQVVINSSMYASYENANLSNIWFSYTNGTVINSWLQSGNSSSDSNTTYWLKLDYSIAAGNTVEIYMNFLPAGSFAFNTLTTGEAPQLSAVYGQFDNGNHVFNLYDNFSGTALNTAMWTAPLGSAVYNGLNFTGDREIISTQTFSYPSYVEAYGVIAPSLSQSQTSYFLGGVGFANGDISGSSPVMTSGWAQNDTNGPGMSFWNANGNAYTYNYSKSIDPYQYHVYGIGFINDSYTTGLVDGKIANYTTQSLNTISSTQLNAIIGFQENNMPVYANFSWIFVRNSLVNGQVNLPYTLQSPTYNVTFSPIGFTSNSKWQVSVDGLVTTIGTGNLSLSLMNGTYQATFTTFNGYEPYPKTFTFTVSGSSETLDLIFESPYNQTLLRASETFSSGLSNPQPGFVVNTSKVSNPYAITSLSMSQKNNMLFASMFNQGSIYIRNLTNNLLYKLSVGSGVFSSYYDPSSNLLYAVSSTTGNLSIINLTYMAITANISLPWAASGLSFITQGSTSGQIYVVTLNEINTADYVINAEVLDTNGTLVKNVTFKSIGSSSMEFGILPSEYMGNLVVTNETGIWALDPYTGTSIFTPAPSQFAPVDQIQYGDTGQFIVANGSGNGYLTYNITTHSIVKNFLNIPGIPYSGVYDPATGVEYMAIMNTTPELVGYSTANNSIIASAPFEPFGSFMLYDSNNQNLYSTLMPYYTETSEFNSPVYVYNTSRLYSVTFEESGLPSGTPWYLEVNGVQHTLNGNSYSVTSVNGTSYTFNAENTSSYYSPNAFANSTTIEGNSVVVNFNYYHYAYILGYYNQSGVNITVNGVSIGQDNVYFYESVTAGTYKVVVSAPGYVTKYFNFTLSPGASENVSAFLSAIQKNTTSPSPFSTSDIYYIVGGVVAAGAVAGAALFVRKRGKP